jgi:hypothetical protein
MCANAPDAFGTYAQHGCDIPLSHARFYFGSFDPDRLDIPAECSRHSPLANWISTGLKSTA